MTTLGCRRCLFTLILGLVLMLAGCRSDTDDLADFVARTQTGQPQPIEPMPDIATYQPATYRPAGRRSPFEAVERAQPNRDNGIRPNRDRQLEPLEQYPLDALQMVGTIASSGVTYALIKAPDQVVHRVAAGDHLGRHYGQINTIGPQGVSLTEIVADNNGGYVKRGASLAAPQ